jgi:hypothetical protein
MNNVSEGATPEVKQATDNCAMSITGLGGKSHKWSWLWVDGKMTDQVKCMNCGETRTPQRTERG